MIRFYIDAARMTRKGRLRNASPALHGIHLREDDIEPMVAFLRALNEDYE